ncbi:serine-rich adhesin for platelets-like, partial [Musca vetustissima]|uniref:serine-rich adhesin for platelets-like n=1 Tax=Musca vetustissima TaxID=27455 RepID=UPI002AB7DFD7
FTICSSSAILEQRLKTITQVSTNSSSSSSNSNSQHHHIPAETTNKSYKITDSLPNLPVTLTTMTTATTVTTTLYQAPPIQTSLSLSSSVVVAENSEVASAMSGTSISTSMERKSPSSALKTLETAALSEPLPSPSAISSASASSSSSLSSADSPMAIETAEKSPFSSFSLTATTQIENEPLTVDDFNASSELLSGPTSILNTHDASDLPPLSEAEQAAKDLLTKGFSIPTYLPPFPVFAVADLPAYLNTVSSTTTEAPSNHHMSPDDMSSLENLLFFDNSDDQQKQQLLRRRQQHRKLQIPRRNSSLVGPNNVTVQEGSHAYLPCR